MSDSENVRKRSPKKPPVRGNRKTVEGIVHSAAMDKSIVVAIKRQVRHPKYKKYLTRTSKLYAHDETNDARIGDLVRIRETKPLSKLKHWRLVDVLKRAPRIDADAQPVETIQSDATSVVESDAVVETADAESEGAPQTDVEPTTEGD